MPLVPDGNLDLSDLGLSVWLLYGYFEHVFVFFCFLMDQIVQARFLFRNCKEFLNGHANAWHASYL